MAATVEERHDEGIARYLRRRLRRTLRVRREKRAGATRKSDAKVLERRITVETIPEMDTAPGMAAEDIKRRDAEILERAFTVETMPDVPTTLSEAYPVDPEARDNDKRAIVITECTGTFNMIACNRAWENLCGYAEEEIVGRDSSILQGPDTNHIGLRDAVQRLFEEEKPVRVVTTNYRKNGSRFKNLLTLGAVRDESGKMTHCVAVLKDVSSWSSRRW